jgi:hypothetical protein
VSSSHAAREDGLNASKSVTHFSHLFYVSVDVVAVQTASTTPNGHVPARNPYTDDAPHAAENRRTNARDRSSSAYATSIVDTATNPNKVRMLTGSV